MKKLIITLAIVFISATSFAKTVTLAWDASPSDNLVTGYNAYFVVRDSGEPQEKRDAGNKLTITIVGLADADTHDFVVTAYAADGRESVPSNKVTSPPCEEVLPPVQSEPTQQCTQTVIMNNYF